MQFLNKVKTKLGHGAWYPFYNTFYERVRLDPYMIFLESRGGRALESNILEILKELATEPYHAFKIILSVRDTAMETIKNKIKHHGIRVDRVVRMGSVAYYYYLSRAGFLVNDTTFPGRFIKKDKQIYLNTWHGTPLKKMGRNNKSEVVSMGNVMRNLLCADYLVFPNQYMEEKMSDAYMLGELYRGHILHEGYPRNDIFQKTESGTKLKIDRGWKDKRLIAYLPTFRGRFDWIDEDKYIQVLKESLQIWEQQLEEDELLLVKLHPFVRTQICFDDYQNIRVFPKEWDTNEGLNACDALITDYSSVMYDYANSRRKIVLFVYDLEQYMNVRGLYEEILQYPFQIARTPLEVMEAIHEPGGEPSGAFLERYATWDDGNGSSRVCRQVFLGESCCRMARAKQDGRKNILIYGGNLAQNGITTALCAMLKYMDLDKYHYFVSFRTDYLKEFPERADRIPENVGVFPLASEMNMDLLTGAACMLWIKFGMSNPWIKRRIQNVYKREWKKHFGNCQFDKVIHYNGYETYMIGLIKEAACPRIIWVHNDMEQEIRTRKNQNSYPLREAYRSYERVIAVSEDILKSIYNISGKKDNVEVISNLIDYNNILARAEQQIAFDKDTVSNVSLDKLKKILEGHSDKFINIGRFSPEKGHYRLIDAFERYWSRHEDAYLIIVGGEGVLYQDVSEYAKSKKSSAHILLMMRVSNPMPILKRCDLFLLSSYYEGLGLVLMEADTLGVPVAACDVQGPRGFLQKYGGMLVENSADGLFHAMEEYHRGNMHPMNVDYEALNRETKEKCEALIDEDF